MADRPGSLVSGAEEIDNCIKKLDEKSGQSVTIKSCFYGGMSNHDNFLSLADLTNLLASTVSQIFESILLSVARTTISFPLGSKTP